MLGDRGHWGAMRLLPFPAAINFPGTRRHLIRKFNSNYTSRLVRFSFLILIGRFVILEL